MWMYRMDEGQHLRRLIEGPEYTRRQDLPPVYAVNGALYFTDVAWLRRTRKFVTSESVGYVMPAERSVDLDTPIDWRLAELLLEGRPAGSR
jgi:CMP-N-acetylneuraminic acid synthetase